MQIMHIDRTQKRLVLIMVSGLAMVSALPESQSEAVEVRLHRNVGGGPRVQLVRRSTRMARRGRYCPPVQCDNGVVATTPATSVNPQTHLTARIQIKVSADARDVARSSNQFAFD